MPIEQHGCALFAPDEVDDVPWPDSPQGREAKGWMGPMMKGGTAAYIENVDTDVYMLLIDGVVGTDAPLIVPVTVTDPPRKRNAYVCSHHNHFIAYARDELWELRSPILEAGLSASLVPAGWALDAAALDRAVFVNNWLLSTNLFPPGLDQDAVERATRLLAERFDDRAIVWRSVNDDDSPPAPDAFTNLGYKLVLSRQVYFQHDAATQLKTNKRFKDDRRVFKRHDYDVIDGDALLPHVERLVHLYNQLYLDKYSRHNPQFTPSLFTQWIETDTVHLSALVRDDIIEGVLGWYGRGGVMTVPVVGYDTALPNELALYRRLTVMMSEAAAKHGLLLNASAGAAGFKRLRGGAPVLEYSAVYADHLAAWRRWPWAMFSWGMHNFGVPIFQKYQV